MHIAAHISLRGEVVHAGEKKQKLFFMFSHAHIIPESVVDREPCKEFK